MSLIFSPAESAWVVYVSDPLGSPVDVSYDLPANINPLVSSANPIVSLLTCTEAGAVPLPDVLNVNCEYPRVPVAPLSHALSLMNTARASRPLSYAAYPATLSFGTLSSAMYVVIELLLEFPMNDAATIAA